MGKKSQVHSKPIQTDKNALPKKKSKSLEKVVELKKKKRKHIPNPGKGKTDNPAENLRKVVANVKRSKEDVSSNWQAFLSSGLAPVDKKVPCTARKPNCKAIRGKRFGRNGNCSNLAGNPDSKQNSSLTSVPNFDHSLEEAYISEVNPKSEKEKHELTRCIAVDCEMVGVFDGKENVLARVSLVNQHGECVYDRFVKPKEEVSDYRTKVSGVRPSDLKRGEEFETVQKEVAAILDGKILVGHAIRNDLKVLMLNHPPKMIRDTSRFKPFRNVTNGRTPSLKKLASEILGVSIQGGEHSSVEDAKATMQLYNLYQKEWEDHRLQRKSKF